MILNFEETQNKRRHNEQTLDVKHAPLMKIDRWISNMDVSKKCPKKHPVQVEKEQGKNNCCIQEQ